MIESTGSEKRSTHQEPVVSILVPVLNEAEGVEHVLTQLRSQSFSAIEIIIADGGSIDETPDIVRRHALDDSRVVLVENPRRLQSAGLNEAMRVAQASLLVRLDGHSSVNADYVERCVELLRSTGADVVGGRMVADPTNTPMAQAIAAAMHRSWAAGPARFHRPGDAGEVETVYLGSFRREAVEAAGGWSEDVGVNEDFDLNHRIRRSGGRVWYDPTLEIRYRPRSTLRAVARQYFRYGRSKASMLRNHPNSVRCRQMAPAALVPAAILALLPGGRAARLAVVAHPALICGLAACEPNMPGLARMRLAAVAVTMHWCWSGGLWFGAVRRFPPAG